MRGPPDPALDVEALLEGLSRLRGVEFDAVLPPVRAAVGVPEVEVPWSDLVAQIPQALPVDAWIREPGEAVGGAVRLDGVTDEDARRSSIT